MLSTSKSRGVCMLPAGEPTQLVGRLCRHGFHGDGWLDTRRVGLSRRCGILDRVMVGIAVVGWTGGKAGWLKAGTQGCDGRVLVRDTGSQDRW